MATFGTHVVDFQMLVTTTVLLIGFCLIATIILANNCDWACENRAYLHTNFGLIFELQFTITFKLLKIHY